MAKKRIRCKGQSIKCTSICILYGNGLVGGGQYNYKKVEEVEDFATCVNVRMMASYDEEESTMQGTQSPKKT